MPGESTSRKPGRQVEIKPLRGKGLRSPPERLLVVRTDRLGDLILSFPAVEALRSAYPRSAIDLLVHPYTAPLARLQRSTRHVGVDSFQGIRGLPALVRWLRDRSYDAVFHLYPRPRLALATALAFIPVRIGTKYRYYSMLFSHRVPLHREGSGKHERDLNLLLLESLGIPTSGADAGIEVPEQTRAATLRLLRRRGVDPEKPLVVLHPGSGGSSLNWPAESFGRLARILAREGFSVLVTGTEGEREVIRSVVSMGECDALDLSGRLDLAGLAALLELADLLVANSTGPLHLADALGTQVLGLYSPFRSALPDRWGPYHQPGNVLVPPVETCSRCRGAWCEAFNCMQRISPEEVFQKIREIRSRSRNPWPKGTLLEGVHVPSAVPQQEEIL